MNLFKKALMPLIFLLALSSLPYAHTYDTDEDSGSLTLTELNFHDAIKEFKYVLVNFHALWCRYSKKLKPEWKNLATTVGSKFSQVKTAKLEAYDEKKIAEEFGVEGYPTIKLFIDQKPVTYQGLRNENSILEFVKRQLREPLDVVTDPKEVEEKKKEYEWIGILIGNDNDAVKAVAAAHGDINFVKSSSSDVISKYGNPSTGQFVLVRNISSDHKVYTGSLTEKDLEAFINANLFNPVSKFSKGTAERIFLSEDPSMILIKKDNSDGKSALDAFNTANGKIGDKIFMAVANYEDDISKLLGDNLGVAESDLPLVVIVRADRERIRKYKLEGSISADSIGKFHDDYNNKKAKRFYLSEPVPAEQPDLVTKVVTNNFKDLVLNPEKDVLLLIWAPWCGHCRSMMPVYDNVARKTRNVGNFLIGKIDASVNDLEGFGLDIVEYPTILYFTKDDKENPIEFKGERNEYVFNDFIRAHSKVDLGQMKGPNPFDRNEL